MKGIPAQSELFNLAWRPQSKPFRLRVNDLLRINGRLCRVIRVSECAAVVLMNQPVRDFSTRFDKRVRFQPPPITFRISSNSEVEILNRTHKNKKGERHENL